VVEPEPFAVEEPPIAVAVVSWNTRELLGQALDSLLPDVDQGLAQVWVVDNGSTDGSPELVRDRYPWAKLVLPGSNLGFGAAVNLVSERTSGPWLVAANADVRLAPGALAQLAHTAAAHNRIGMIGPRLELLDGSTQVSAHPFPGLRTAVLLDLHAPRFSSRAARTVRTASAWEPSEAAPVPWITGAFVLMARCAFEQAERFDASQWLYGEDLDLCWRMRQRGWEIVYEPAAHAYHAHSAASARRFDRAALDDHIDAVNYLWTRRRRGAAVARAAATVGVLDASARLAILKVAARRAPRRFGDRAAAARAALAGHLLGLRSESELERRIRRSKGSD
jgi:GT2 family glycosyltransferase